MLLKAYVKASAIAADVKDYMQRLRDDESGASLIEYSLLIGLISVAVVATIGLVGGHVKTAWTGLETAMQPAAPAA